jgi:hypothetical protein
LEGMWFVENWHGYGVESTYEASEPSTGLIGHHSVNIGVRIRLRDAHCSNELSYKWWC